MLLMIDNYDSLTYNLAQAFGGLGAEMTIVRNDAVTIDEIERMRPDQIVISPGPCTPDEAGVSLDVIRHFGGIVPLLGVCLGHQAIGQAFGAKVVRAPQPTHGKTAELEHRCEGVFRDVPERFVVARYHSLMVDPVTLPGCLEVTASYRGIIMGMRHRTLPCLEGVQFHPESFLTPSGPKLLGRFLQYRLPAPDGSEERAA